MSYNAITAVDIANALATAKPITTTLCSAVTSVSDAASVQLKAGPKAFAVKLTGTGSVSATVKILVSTNNTDWLAGPDYQYMLTGTTTVYDGSQENDSWPYHRASITAISGTGAAVTVTASA
jgi:hypothetical protein